MEKRKHIPPGTKIFYFHADGNSYSTNNVDQEFSDKVIFTCTAINEETTRRKFGNFITSLLKQPITHV